MLAVALACGSATVGRACPEIVVDHGTFEATAFEGRLVPPWEGEELPEVEIEFLIHEQGDEKSEAQRVPVERNGEFFLALPEGTYEFTVRVEEYFFTIVGVVVIDAETEESDPIELHGHWC